MQDQKLLPDAPSEDSPTSFSVMQIMESWSPLILDPMKEQTDFSPTAHLI